jgi:hypothetical protein
MKDIGGGNLGFLHKWVSVLSCLLTLDDCHLLQDWVELLLEYKMRAFKERQGLKLPKISA